MPATSPRLALLAVLCLVQTACDGEQEQEPVGDNELLTQVRDDGYRDWARAPGHAEREPTTAPHGAAVEIFTNQVVVDALANVDGLGLTRWPEGSTIVLEGYVDLAARDAVQLAILQKRSGTWYWEQYQADELERPRFSGRPDVCLGCHLGANDFVRSFPLPKPVEDK